MSTPLDWNAIQWFSDNVATYRSGLVDGFAVLESLESHGDYRRPRSFACLLVDGIDDHLTEPSLTGTEIATNDGTATPTVSAGRIDFTAGTVFNLQVDNGSVYWCNEEEGDQFYDSSGNARTATLVGANLTTARDSSTGMNPNPANSLGYIEAAGGVIAPLNSGLPGTSYTGNSPLPATIDSVVATFDGVDDYLSVPHLVGDETLTEFEGSSTPTISAGRIDFTIGTAAKLVISDGTHYEFCEGSGTTVHDIANAPGGGQNNGTVTNATTATGQGFWANRSTARRDPCIDYGGRWQANFVNTQGHIEVPDDDSLDITGPVSLFLWVRAPTTTPAPIISNKGPAAALVLQHASFTRFFYYNGTADSDQMGSDWADGEWHWLGFTYDGTTKRLWLDNVQLDSAVVSPVAANTSDWGIGDRAGGAAGVNGNIRDVRLYNKELTSQERADLFAGVDVSDSLVAHLPLDDSGRAYDASGNGNDGSLVGATDDTFWSFVPGLISGASASDGNPLTIPAGHFGPPQSRLIFDPWAAPELSQINYPAESPPGELLRLTAPSQTKFRSEQGATELALGTAFADGDNKLFTVPAPGLSGQDLAAALEYIQRIGPAFLPAWAVNSNPRVHSLVQ